MAGMHRLLVVDDNPDITNLIGEIAQDDGFEVHRLNDSSAFYDRFGEIDPDVLCIDIHMPDVDGIEILRWLSNADCRAAVIILSGGDPLFTTVAERIGVAAKLQISTVPKPFQIGDFRKVLKESLIAVRPDAA